jgi:hypothetical protein
MHDDPGFETRYGQDIFLCILQNVQAVSRIYPASYSVSTRFFPGNKAAEAWSSPPPSSADVMNEWNYTFSPLTCVDKDNFTFQSNISANSLHYFRLYFQVSIDQQTPQTSVISDISIKVTYTFFSELWHIYFKYNKVFMHLQSHKNGA